MNTFLEAVVPYRPRYISRISGSSVTGFFLGLRMSRCSSKV